MALRIFSAILGFITAMALVNWLDNYVWFIIALTGGVAGGIVVYQVLVSMFSKQPR